MALAKNVWSWIDPAALRRRRAWGIALIATLVAPPALGQSMATTQASLQLAVCLNDWDSAIARTHQLEQMPNIPVKTRAELILLSRQMQRWRLSQTAVSNIDGCGPVLAGFGIPGYTGRPPAIDRALANAGLTAPIVIPDLTLRRQEALWQAGLGVSADPSLVPLAGAQRINTRTGSGVSTGAVSRWIDVYAFLGAQGDRANVAVDVIEQRQGILHADDRALLFLFDGEGRLLAEARPSPPGQPQLEAVALPATGVYYAAVTTPQHYPLLDDDGIIIGWEGIGTSAVTYTLTVTAVTPSPVIANLPLAQGTVREEAPE